MDAQQLATELALYPSELVAALDFVNEKCKTGDEMIREGGWHISPGPEYDMWDRARISIARCLSENDGDIMYDFIYRQMREGDAGTTAIEKWIEYCDKYPNV